MSLRATLLLPCLALLAALPACGGAESSEEASADAITSRRDALWDEPGALGVQLRAPFADLFAASEASTGEDLPKRSGVMRVAGKDIKVTLRRRGNTAALSSECSFPKLKITVEAGQDLSGTPLRGHEKLALNTHCGERKTTERTPFGRVANEVSPMREDLAYRMARALELPTYRTRVATITYVDDAAPNEPLVRHGLFIEHKDEALARFVAEDLVPDGSKALEVSSEENPDGEENPDLMDRPLAARIHLAEALLGNRDFRLHLGALDEPDHWTESGPVISPPLWNIDVFGKVGDKQVPILQDFDLSGVVAPVTGEPTLDPSRTFGADSATQVALGGVQSARRMFSREELDAAIAAVKARRAAVEAEVARGTVDPEGRANAEKLVREFFALLEPDSVYVPVVTSKDVYVVDPKTGEDDERCLAPIPVGTPAARVAASAPRKVNGRTLVEVRLFDMKYFLPCLYPADAVHDTPARTAWVPDTIQISTAFPAASAGEGCMSSTLGHRVDQQECVQRPSDKSWFRCVGSEQWALSSAEDPQCTARHPIP